MTPRATILRFLQQDALNFWLTNYIPRRRTTSLIGWFSKLEQPLICALSLRVWRFFSDLDLSDAAEPRFASMHACFTRRLKPGARPFAADPQIVASPCDAIVGALGTVSGNQVLQVKGSPYDLDDLLGETGKSADFAGGTYVTLRLTSSMYHRFHAPHDCRVRAVRHIDGDTWNVNPPTLQRVARVFCRNERAVIETTLLAGGEAVTLVPVAAILVAGIRLSFMAVPQGPETRVCDVTLRKGEEMGWFEHGSTIIVLAAPGCRICTGVEQGQPIRAGAPLLQRGSKEGLLF